MNSPHNNNLKLKIFLLVTVWICQTGLQELVDAGQATASDATSSTAALTPAESMACMQLDDGLQIELVAAEPLVQDPVAICWDASGALYVAEMGDYPQQPQGGRIRKLVDSDSDGTYDQYSMFVPQVTYPASVLPFRDGILVAAAPDILWFRDPDGDGVAEIREVLLTGFVEGNPQLRVNGLIWGLDSWVYGANGRSGGRVYFPESGDQSGSNPTSINNRDFRFHPQQRRLETTGGFTQFGQSFDDFGQRFISFNTVHIRHVVMEQRYLERNPMAPITATTAEISLEGSTPRIFPVSQTTRRFNTEPPGYFNASCGLSIYRGHLLPDQYRGNAFACEPLSNLVHRDILEPNGVTFTARRPADQPDREFLASSDPWFRPVNTTTGPDGALYIVDFYRPWVEHPQFVADLDLKTSVDFSVGGQYGRIYRVLPADHTSQCLPTNLAHLTDPALIELLACPNAWQRETAQRLLVERPTNELDLLRKTAKTSEVALQRLHAYGVLNGLDAQSQGSLSNSRSDASALRQVEMAGMLTDSSPAIRRAGLQWCESLSESSTEDHAQWITRIAPLIQDSHPQVRFQAVASLGYFDHAARLEPLAHATLHYSSDPWMRQAIYSSIGGQSVAFVEALLEAKLNILELDFEQMQWLLSVAGSEAVQQGEALEELIRRVSDDQAMNVEHQPVWQLILSVAVARRLGADWVASFAAREKCFSEFLHSVPQWAIDDVPLQQKLLALALTEFLNEPIVVDAWRQCLSHEQPLLVQQWAARAAASSTSVPPPEQSRSVGSTGDQPRSPSTEGDNPQSSLVSDNTRAELLMNALNSTSPLARRTVLDLLIGRTEFAIRLADAIQEGSVEVSQLDALQRQLLIERLPPERRQPLQEKMSVMKKSDSVLRLPEYIQALDSGADRELGRRLYQEHCQSCHAIGSIGNRVGPDLTAVAGRSPTDLITDILDPNRSVAADGVAYALLTHDGEVIAGVIAGETTNSVTLRKAGGELVSVLRQEIQELRHLGKSLMPEGFEATLTPEQMSALIAFLKSLH